MKSNLLLAAAASLLLSACHELPDYDNNTAADNFEALWQEVDRHYCFFDEKDVDWQAIHDKYVIQAKGNAGGQPLFRIMAAMLDELRDGHVNLSAPFATSYYRNWWSDYPQNYDRRLVEQYYFGFKYSSIGAIDYGLLPGNVGYMRWPSFESSLGEGNLDYILYSFNMAVGLIIDIRDNGGGDVTNAASLASRFVTEKTAAGFIRHKTGPGHSDFSEPFEITIEPPGNGHFLWVKPVVVLTNRSTFSAANYFAGIMKHLPNVTIAGATTGGGAGMPYSLELPNGWGVRFSACPVYDATGVCTESGIEPTKGCVVDLDPIEALGGHDTMLDFAIRLLIDKASGNQFSPD